ncbi:hypothetical protein HS7_13030 [Sulfolobales archaeon HS-7]|nr:hypothetical protein HS7_13030 [Sulfolobales archaeon HS-7]
MDSAVEEMLLVIAVVAIGLALFSFTVSYFVPKEQFSTYQQYSSNLASQTTISVGPLFVNKGVGSLVIVAYNPDYSGNFSVIAFPISSTYAASAGIITPQSLSYSVYLPNGKLAKEYNCNEIYDLNGNLLIPNQLQVYTIPANTPVTINVNGVSSGDYILIWIVYATGIYGFRVGYTFTGVPASQ